MIKTTLYIMVALRNVSDITNIHMQRIPTFLNDNNQTFQLIYFCSN